MVCLCDRHPTRNGFEVLSLGTGGGAWKCQHTYPQGNATSLHSLGSFPIPRKPNGGRVFFLCHLLSFFQGIRKIVCCVRGKCKVALERVREVLLNAILHSVTHPTIFPIQLRILPPWKPKRSQSILFLPPFGLSPGDWGHFPQLCEFSLVPTISCEHLYVSCILQGTLG